MAEIFEILIEISQATYLLFLTISCERVSQNQKADFFFFFNKLYYLICKSGLHHFFLIKILIIEEKRFEQLTSLLETLKYVSWVTKF